jgi:hypothetical protein
MNFLITIALLLSLCACAPVEKKVDQMKLEEITSRTDTTEGFSDIFLHITDEVKLDSSHIYTVKGRFKGKIVGVNVELASNIPQGITTDGEINAKTGFVENGLKLSSIGQESNDLLKALSDLYNIPSNKLFSKKVISATAFSLNQKVADLDKGDYYKFKLFFNENGNEEQYAEIYLNINTEEKVIELHEKDPEYRTAIINALTE